jgi:sugar phosphate isomerase/epimerase
VTLLLEPLNRCETHFLNRVEQAVDIPRRVGSPAVQVMPDLFHMNIEDRPRHEGQPAVQRLAVHQSEQRTRVPGADTAPGHPVVRPGVHDTQQRGNAPCHAAFSCWGLMVVP